MRTLNKFVWSCLSTIICVMFHHDVMGANETDYSICTATINYLDKLADNADDAGAWKAKCNNYIHPNTTSYVKWELALPAKPHAEKIKLCNKGFYIHSCIANDGTTIYAPPDTTLCNPKRWTNDACAACPDGGTTDGPQYVWVINNMPSPPDQIFYVCSNYDVWEGHERDDKDVYMHEIQINCDTGAVAERNADLSQITDCYKSQGDKISDKTGTRILKCEKCNYTRPE